MNRFSDIEIGNKMLPLIGVYWLHPLVSLEQALEPVMSCIDQMDQSIKEAKKRCQYPSKHQLTSDESAAVYLYTMESGVNSFYHMLNDALRSENRQPIRPWFGFLKLFDTAFIKLPIVKQSVWPGSHENINQKSKKKEIFTWWSVSSYSLSLEAIKDLVNLDTSSTIFIIETENAKNISDYTSFADEQEVILRLDTQLCMKSDALQHHGGLHIVDLVELHLSHEEHLSPVIDSLHLSSKLGKENAFRVIEPLMESNPHSTPTMTINSLKQYDQPKTNIKKSIKEK